MEKINRLRFADQKGVSAVEVLVVIAIGLILTSVAISQFGNSKVQLQRQNVAREFKNNLERTRFDSVRRRVDDDDFANMSQVIIKSSTSYEVRIDSNQDGIISSGEVKSIDFAQNSDAKILHATASFPITIRFNRKGHITTNSSGISVSPLFTICSGVCTAATTITPANGNVISISPTGTVAMLYGGDEIPPLDAPNISNVNSESNINLWLSVVEETNTNSNLNSNTNTNTNSNTNTNANSNSNTNINSNANSGSNSNANAVIIIVTPTPTPTPTSTPVSTPTPQPTPIATPSATPTPNTLPECLLDQKPRNPAVCKCSSPRYVRSNGKCQ